MEFEDHRPLYEWVVNNTEMEHHPRQIEFGRLGITNMIMSKRYLKQLVEEHLVTGYDDPRMPTLVGLKRRGFTPEAIKNFILSTGLSKVNSTTEYGMLEHFLREDLKLKVNRRNAVINPLKVVITNYPEDKIEWLEAENNSENPELGTYKIPFGRNIYIEQEDFLPEKPNKHWKRLSLGLEVRLMHAYFIKCNDLLQQLKRAQLENRLDARLKHFSKYRLLIIDELGYLPINKEDSNLFFQLIDMRYEKKSTILTTNMNFNEWDGIFYDAVVANAIMDRILHHAHVIPISGKSYRLKDHLKQTD